MNIIIYVLPKKLTICDDVDSYVKCCFSIWPTFLDVPKYTHDILYSALASNTSRGVIMTFLLMSSLLVSSRMPTFIVFFWLGVFNLIIDMLKFTPGDKVVVFFCCWQINWLFYKQFIYWWLLLK